MTVLLVALVVVCALGIAVQFGRSVWARARSAERHRQARDTLAGMTHGAAPSPAGDGEHDYQAHVRLLGSSGEAGANGGRSLPPPRALPPVQHSNSSPLRRPSRATSASRQHSEAPPLAAPSNEEPEDEPTRVIPGLTPPPPHSPPLRPAPAARPHVFYFDDLSPLSSARGPEGDVTPSNAPSPANPPAELTAAASLAGPDGQRRTAAQALVAAGVALVVAAGAVYIALASHKGPGGLASGPGTPSPAPTHVLGSKAGRTSTPTPSRTGSLPTSASSTSLPSSSTTRATTTTTPRQPVELISAVGGTDTFQLTSRTASIVVTASGPCWVEVRAGSSSGQVVTEETLAAGQQAKVTGPAWIRLGDPPNAAVTVDGTPTTIPGARSGVPLNLDFTVS